MVGKRLVSIAEIARELDAPESTLHYWKNRYAAFLPSLGQGRQKRFKPEALEAFRTIASMLRQGHAPAEVTAHLSSIYPMTPASVTEAGAFAAPAQPPLDPVQIGVQIGAQIGAEVARSLAQNLGEFLARAQASLPAGASTPLAPTLALAQADQDRMAGQETKLTALEEENTLFRSKLEVLEAELVRLRKDRRELEKFLLDKIKGVTT